MAGSLHIRMFLRVFQQQTIEIAAKLLQAAPRSVTSRPPVTITWGALIDGQRRRHRSEFFLNCVPLADRIGEFEFQLGRPSPRACSRRLCRYRRPRAASGDRFRTISGYFSAKSALRFSAARN